MTTGSFSHNSILANFFLTQRHVIFIRNCGITALMSKNAQKPSENLRRQSNRFRRSSDHLRNSVPGYRLPSTTYLFSFENQRIFCGRTVIYAHFSICYFNLSTNYMFAYYIFSRRLSDMVATTHTFQKGMKNWSVGVIECEIKVFNLQA